MCDYARAVVGGGVSWDVLSCRFAANTLFLKSLQVCWFSCVCVRFGCSFVVHIVLLLVEVFVGLLGAIFFFVFPVGVMVRDSLADWAGVFCVNSSHWFRPRDLAEIVRRRTLPIYHTGNRVMVLFLLCACVTRG